jgi:hypothetical protein
MANAASQLPSAGGGRFQLRRELGTGGLGVVYEAYDRERDAIVALKQLQRASPESITRLKREFRALENLQHPNLVTRHELFEADGEWFFTMELVEGEDLLTYVGCPPAGTCASDVRTFDERRVRTSFAQLASGLSALHRAGKVHRDVKPSNVLVTDEGRVVLLDFGLVADIDHEPNWTEANAVGTVVYMAPEQAQGGAVGPEADWYAFGAMLYEVLTGAPPFMGPAWQVLTDKQKRAPVSPTRLVRGIAGDLCELCLELLSIDPTRRPAGTAVASRLGVEVFVDANEASGEDARPGRGKDTLSAQRAALFLGRDFELASLEAALEIVRRGEQVSVYVRGESGIGKSALIRAFTTGIPDSDVILLRGRCYEREAVAYKAVDGVIESLADVLRHMPAEALSRLVPQNAGLLLRAFPALTRVPVLSEVKTDLVRDPQELRRRLFAAFRELFVRLSAERPIVMTIDDLQWSDAESLALLTELLRGPSAPRVMFLASWRDVQEGENTGMDLDALPAHAQLITLEPLSPAESRRLAEKLLEMAGADTARAHEVAVASGGRPMFIDELARFTSLSDQKDVARVEDALWGRIERLDPAARRLVEIHAVASAPLSPATAARAARLADGEFTRYLSALRVMRLLRTAVTRGGEAIELYHDSVRRAVHSQLSHAMQQSLHADLARALRLTRHGNLEQLAGHYEASGDREQATYFLLKAAEQAVHGLAFRYAADLYGRALSLLPAEHAERHVTLVRHGEALANAGCGLLASEAYTLAAQSAAPYEALDLARRAAHQLLITGHIGDGVLALEKVLARDGIPLAKTPGRAVLAVLFKRFKLKLRGLDFTRRDESAVAPEARERADTCWRAGLSLGMVDPIRGQSLSLRAVEEAFKVGDPYRVARAIAVHAGYLAGAGISNERDVGRILELATQLSLEAGSQHALAVTMGARAQALFLLAKFRPALECSGEAEQLLREQCVGVHWELNIVRLWGMRARVYLGRYDEISARLPGLLEESRQRGDLFGEVSLRASVQGLSLLGQDQADDAIADLEDTLARWSPAGFHTQHYYYLTTRAQIALYAGRLDEAQAFANKARDGVERSLLKRIQSVRVIVYQLCARVAAARALAGAPEERATIRKFARKLGSEGVGWASAHAALLGATLELQVGQPERALPLLEAALAGYDAADMAQYLAATKQRLGTLVGGDRGRALRAEAEAWFREERIVRPDRLLALTAPGFHFGAEG